MASSTPTSTPDVHWADASVFLENVCQDMTVGSLIHGENFSLFEAMSALEIMDPKMDAGMATAGVRSVEEAIASGAGPIGLSVLELIDVMDHLLACEATWHNGSSLAQTVYTCLYLQDVDRTAPNALLHALCRAVKATCNSIRTLACKADVREEEDFVTASFGLPLEGDTDSKSLIQLAAAEEIVARRMKAAKGGAASKKAATGNGAARPVDDGPLLDEGLCRALLSRIRFRKAFYHALANMDKPQGRGLDLARKHLASAQSELDNIRSIPLTPNCELNRNPNSNLKPDSSPNLSSKYQLSEAALAAADATSSLGFIPNQNSSTTQPSPEPTEGSTKPATSKQPTSSEASRGPFQNSPPQNTTSPTPEENSESSNSAFPAQAEKSDTSELDTSLSSTASPLLVLSSAAAGFADPQLPGSCAAEDVPGGDSTATGRRAKGFDELVNRRLLLPTPPRPIKMLSWIETLASLEKLLDELLRICEVPLGGSLRELERFLLALQAGGLGPIARCRVQQLIVQQRTEIFGREMKPLLLKELRLPEDGGFAKDEQLSHFLFRAGKAEVAYLKILCGNPSRQRRELAKLLPDWNDLVSRGEAAAVTPLFRTFVEEVYPKGWWPHSILVSWTAEQACRAIRQMLLLGFQTDLYAPHEYCYLYWYLDHVLATLLHNAEAREKNWAHRRQAKKAGPQVKDKKGGRRKMPPGVSTKTPEIQFQRSVDLALLQCHADLCKALVRMLVALKADGKLLFRGTPCSGEQERFEQRFEVLRRVHIPEPMPYAAFKEGTNISSLKVAEVYQMSFDFYQETARQALAFQEQVANDTEMDSVTRKHFGNETLRLSQVAARNGTALQVAHGVGPGPTLKASFDFSIHPCFPVVVLKRS